MAVWENWLDCASGQSPLAGSFEHGNDSLVSIEAGNFLTTWETINFSRLFRVVRSLVKIHRVFVLLHFVSHLFFSRAQWQHVLRRMDCGFASHSRHWCMSAWFYVALSCVGRGHVDGSIPVQGVPPKYLKHSRSPKLIVIRNRPKGLIYEICLSFRKLKPESMSQNV